MVIACWRSNVWEMIDLKFSPTAKLGGRERAGRKRGGQKIVWKDRVRMQLGGEKESEISSMCEPLTTN